MAIQDVTLKMQSNWVFIAHAVECRNQIELCLVFEKYWPPFDCLLVFLDEWQFPWFCRLGGVIQLKFAKLTVVGRVGGYVVVH